MSRAACVTVIRSRVMKCFLVLVLCLGAGWVEGGALRCTPEGDSSCTNQETYEGGKRALAAPPEGVQCATGSSWLSQCNRCSCPAGVPACTYVGCSGNYTEPARSCAEGSEWRNACNTCWCTATGLAVCTRVGCDPVTEDKDSPPSKSVRDTVNYSEDLSASVQVYRGSRAKIDAETIEEASRRISGKQTKIIDIDDTEHPDVEIEKLNLETLDHSFEELDYNIYEPESDLNHVHTIQDQSNVLEEVDVKDRDKHTLLKRSVCKPNEAFQAECNSCKCAPDGQSYSCSHNECMEGEKNKEVEVFMESEGLDHVESHTVCAARGTFYIGCNTCHCNAHGTDYSCTNKPCPLPEDVELFHELKDMKPIIPYTDKDNINRN